MPITYSIECEDNAAIVTCQRCNKRHLVAQMRESQFGRVCRFCMPYMEPGRQEKPQAEPQVERRLWSDFDFAKFRREQGEG